MLDAVWHDSDHSLTITVLMGSTMPASNVIPLSNRPMSAAQAAREVFKCHENSLYQWLRNPALGIPHQHLNGKYRLFPDQCIAWMARQTKNPLPAEPVVVAKKPKPRLTKRSVRPKRRAAE